MNDLLNLTPQQLRRAANLQDKLASLQKELSRILGASTPTVDGAAPRKRRRMSASARARIAAAQKKRWAKQRGPKAPRASAKPRRKMTAAGRKRLAQLARARWAKARAAGKTTLG